MTLRAGFYTVSLAVKLLRRELESPTLHWSHDKEKSEIDSEHALPCYLPLFPAFLALELRGVIYKRPEKRIRQRFDLQSLTICDYTYDSRVQLHQRATIDLLCLFLLFKEPKFQHICPRTRQEDDVEWGGLTSGNSVLLRSRGIYYYQPPRLRSLLSACARLRRA
ncbi:uncharacterized protein PHACADRAFT_203084 [Phanerochaete carnosa HHB-10118-sp]|uniref:Uncharacterized protein n=1 Tax=Phanerochaete carnosa (strain HHB-10118-sp) TaxID=650164 RepID=K5UFJ5_PHACS|nr:uncharacterized protein PHACADRAFT_203084 [Phanerochaete carnosa HHB-10118-sp]EKM48221.1 hypothetical protein PHACADRAFT_203084 [Phanerochaete carnosa HHB-10118-sp]